MLYSLPLVWYGLRHKVLPVLSVGLSAATLALVLAGAVGVSYQPIERFQLFLNVRLGVQLLLIGGLFWHLYWMKRYPQSFHWWKQVVTGFQATTVLAGFALLTTQANDFFQHVITQASGLDVTQLGYTRFTLLVVIWTLYAVPVIWLALRRRSPAVLWPAVGIMALATGTAAVVGAAYQPIERFQPVLNARVVMMALLMAGLIVIGRWLAGSWKIRFSRLVPWASAASALFYGAVLVLGFELVTAETNDYFRHLSGASTIRLGSPAGLFLEAMVLASIWTVFSLVVVWLGVRRTSAIVLAAGLGVAALGVGTGSIAGFLLQPGDVLPLLLSVRACVLPFLMAVLFLHLHLLREQRSVYRWLSKVSTVMQAAIVVLGFELITGETRDFFQQSAQSSSSSAATHLRNVEQVTLSVVWLLYAGILLVCGIWWRLRWLRLSAIGLFGLIIVKVFVYDLAFLPPDLRGISFAGLGIILLGISYLYQRYRGIILGGNARAEMI
jgi:uncharacterized membrane protein